jgi:hypothetical protein
MLPPSLDELITVTHRVRIVNEVLNKIDIQPLIHFFLIAFFSILPNSFYHKKQYVQKNTL